MSALCPKCDGVPCAPEIPECRGCFDCDFTGTLEGFEQMERMMREGYEALDKYSRDGICERCGAGSEEEAKTKCRPYAIGETGEYGCPGEDLWQEEEGAA